MTPIAPRLTLPLIVLVVIPMTACTRSETPSAPPAADHAIPSSDAELPEGSLFDLDLTFVDHEGRPVAMTSLYGRPTLAAMVYTSCTSICPRITEEMKAAEALLQNAGHRDVDFVLFSLDPGRDTPAAMRQFAIDHHLDTARWRLLAAPEEGVRDLAAALGVKYRAEEDGEIAHSAMMFVIDRSGRIRHRTQGLGQKPADLVAAVERAR
jgi:protein SCO1/2